MCMWDSHMVMLVELGWSTTCPGGAEELSSNTENTSDISLDSSNEAATSTQAIEKSALKSRVVSRGMKSSPSKQQYIIQIRVDRV